MDETCLAAGMVAGEASFEADEGTRAEVGVGGSWVVCKS
jgi:hypothetical protein